jgi:hypothetical protein
MKNKKPFFSSFLENQLDKQQAHSVQGGDSPTDVIQDQAQTQKYPSDQEDNPTKPLLDDPQTKKYPSDNDEDGK